MARSAPSRFGTELQRLRKGAGLTQAQLAERAGISQRGLQDLERGIHQAPRRETVELLAAALGLAGPNRVAFLATTQAQSTAVTAPVCLSPLAPAVPEGLAPLVGREDELALLHRFLTGEGERTDTTRVLFLAGEPGIGKTRLLQATAQEAVARGWCVLFGGCQRRGGEDPYAPLPEALAHHIDLCPPASLGATLAGCAWLVRLAPELAAVLEPLPAAAVAPEQERRLIHAAVARFLANVAGTTGTVLILDDLQWAGPDALDIIVTLARIPGTTRIVGAYRDTEVGPADPLGLLLADLAQARLAIRRQLGPLDLADAAVLLEDLLLDMPDSAGMMDEVLGHAGGTPFFLVSYAQALRQGGPTEVPWNVAQGVRQRAAVLPEIARLILGAAAVVGRRVSRHLLAAAMEEPEKAVLAGLEAACRARLLVEDGDDAYRFAHDLIREVLEADLGAARRAMLHRRVAEALEGDPAGATPDILAHHYVRAGVAHKAVHYLEMAGDHARDQQAHAAAQSRYDEALEQLERLGRTRSASRVREKLGEVLVSAGRYDAALGELERAAESYDAADDLESLARVTVTIAVSPAIAATTLTGSKRITTLLDRLERSGATAAPLAPLYEALGLRLFTAGQYEASLAASEQAATLARGCGDRHTLALAERNRLNILQMLGRLGEALQVGETALPLAETIKDSRCLVWILTDLAHIHTVRGAFAKSRGYIDRAIALAEEMESPANLSFALGSGSWFAALRGEWPRANGDMNRAISASGLADRSWWTSYPPIFLARLSMVQGEWTAATKAAQEALALAGESDDLQALRWASTTMAELDILEDRADAARARLVPLLDRPGLQEYDVTNLLPVLAWAQLELGQVDQAAETVDQALQRARPEEMRLVLVEALRVQALVAIRQGHWADAEQDLREGLALAQQMPHPYAEARLLEVDGQRYAEQGEPDQAQARLEAALAIFRQLGAVADARQVEGALSKRTTREHAKGVTFPGGQMCALSREPSDP